MDADAQLRRIDSGHRSKWHTEILGISSKYEGALLKLYDAPNYPGHNTF